jgi:hypothetical protein
LAIGDDAGDGDLAWEVSDAEPIAAAVIGWMKFVGKGEKEELAKVAAWVIVDEAGVALGCFD